MTGRPLLRSELAIVQAAYEQTNLTMPTEVLVLWEEYSPCRIGTARRFNADFRLRFMRDFPGSEDWKAKVVPVRPHTMGAEYFLSLRNDGVPVMLDLLGGESISFESFAESIPESISRLDEIMSEVLHDTCESVFFLRLAELSTGLSFLASRMPIEGLTHLPAARAELDRCEFYTRSLDGRPVMIDGLIEFSSASHGESGTTKKRGGRVKGNQAGKSPLKVYVLQHVRDASGSEGTQTCGVFSSLELADKALEKLSSLPEYREYLNGFCIEEYLLDEDPS